MWYLSLKYLKACVICHFCFVFYCYVVSCVGFWFWGGDLLCGVLFNFLHIAKTLLIANRTGEVKQHVWKLLLPWESGSVELH